MFDIGWSEMAVIMLLALIIIGPKDLPRVARTVGQWVRKGRALAREFQTSLEEMARETELDDVRKEIEKVGRTDFKKTVENTIDPKGELTKAFNTSTVSPPKQALAEKSGADKSGMDSADQAAAAKPADAETTVSPSASTNGHASGAAPTPAETAHPRAPVPSARQAATGKASPSKSRTAKTAKTNAKTAAATGEPASNAPASGKKPVPSARRSSKPAPSAKGDSDPSSTDDGGSDRTAMAAKPS